MFAKTAILKAIDKNCHFVQIFSLRTNILLNRLWLLINRCGLNAIEEKNALTISITTGKL